jgi:uncharacterized protein (UPF0276 family)
VTLVGAGYRPEMRQLFESDGVLAVECVELIADRYITEEGLTRAWELTPLEGIPTLIHGLAGNVASASGPDSAYLERMALLADVTSAAIYSDHLAFTGSGDHGLGHLAPNRFDDELLELSATHVATIAAQTGRRVLLENLATNVVLPGSTYTPEEFYLRLLQVSDEWDCLLDLTNVWINAQNRRVDTLGFIGSIPPERVRSVHLAGGQRIGAEWVDSHSQRVHEEVFDLLRCLCQRAKPDFVIIERDSNWRHAEEEVGSDLGRTREIILTTTTPQPSGIGLRE